MHPQNDGGPPAGSPGEKASQMLSLAKLNDQKLPQAASAFKHGAGTSGVTFISERVRESFRARRERALEAALRCAREATLPGTNQDEAIALLRAVGRYAEQLRPPSFGGRAAR